MSKDPLKQIAILREAMIRRKTMIEEELANLNKALGEGGGIAVSKGAGSRAAAWRTRAENSMPLSEAVLKVVSTKPLSKKEILEAVGRLGYKFNTKSPMNSLNTFLYTSKAIKKVDGKFGTK